MRRPVLLPLLIVLATLGPDPPGYAQEPDSQEPEDAVYVYDLFQDADSCLELSSRLRRLPLRDAVILSIEQGAEFILDHPDGEEKLHCVLRLLNGSSRRVKALLLQDPVFLERLPEAVRRAALLGAFVARYPGELAGAQVDVEPHGDGKWPNGSGEERRRLLEGLHELLRQVRPTLRGLPLGVVVPWWYAEMAQELPEASPGSLFQVADEIYLMAYSDGDATPHHDPAASLLERLEGAYAFSERGRTHVILAKHEFHSEASLEAGLLRVRHILKHRPNFVGTAVFHAASGFRSPTP